MLKKQLEQIFKDFVRDYAQYSSVSRDAYMRTLQPGATVPEENQIFGDMVAEFEAKAAEYRQKADAILDAKIDEVIAEKTASPSNEAVNVITLLDARNNVTEEDIKDVLDTYGDNYQVYRSLQDIAHKIGKDFTNDHPLAEKELVLKQIKRDVDSYLTYEGIKRRGENFLSFLLENMPEED